MQDTAQNPKDAQTTHMSEAIVLLKIECWDSFMKCSISYNQRSFKMVWFFGLTEMRSYESVYYLALDIL